MNLNWENLENIICRLCGCVAKTVKVESTLDIKLFFELSEESEIKICEECTTFVVQLQEFSHRVRKVDELFQEMKHQKKTFPVDFDYLNKIRNKFQLEPIDIENLEQLADITNDHEKEGNLRIFDSVEVKQEDFFVTSEVEDEIVVEEPEVKRRKRNRQQKKSRNPSNSNKEHSILKLKCHICKNYLAQSFAGLVKHCQEAHNCLPQILCVCGSSLKSYGSYIKHRKSCFNQQCEPIYMCDFCSRKFLNKTNLEGHMTLKHKSDSKKFLCNTCGKRFYFPALLRKHQICHLPPDQKYIHNCPHCDLKFSMKEVLNTHIKRIHRKELPIFACHLCPKIFHRNANLKAHLETHAEVNTYECDVCFKKYKTSYLLYCHKKIHGSKDYVCTIRECSMRFPRKSSLTVHMRRHSDVKQFSCTYEGCSSKFKSNVAMKEHVNSHYGIRPYACPFCPVTFSNRSNCIKHSRNVHPVEYAAHEGNEEMRKVKKLF